MGREIHQLPNNDPARLGRVLDAKWRTIGVDTNALKQQVAERKAAEEQEKQRDLQYARLAGFYDSQIRLNQQEADGVAAQQAEQELMFRTQNQLKDTTREWDLNRPDALLRDRPAREGDADPRLGASSLQVLAGEDLSAGSRKKEQMQQCKGWWEEQAAARADAEERTRQEDAAHGELVKYQDAVQSGAMHEEATIRREANLTKRIENAGLAAARKDAAACEAQWDETMNNHEIESALANPYLSEDPNLAASLLSQFRVRKDHWKGMSVAQRQAIIDEQFRQLEELKAKRRAERMTEACWARTALEVDCALKEQQRMADGFRKQQAAERLAFLQAQAEEKRLRDAKLDNTYANKIAPEYFSQFGTSHR